MSPEDDRTPLEPKKPYSTPKLTRLDAQPDDDHLMAILDLTLLLLDLRDLTNQLEAAILKLSNARRLAAPNVTPLFRNRTRLSDAERDALEKRAAQKPDDTDWTSILEDRG